MIPQSILDFFHAGKSLPFRSMSYFNFLLEATLAGSLLILVVVVLRAVFRKKIGSRLVYLAWILVAVRLLPVPALLVRTAAAAEIARLCYEIGNRHAPLYAPDGTFSCFAVRYDASLEQLIRQLGLAYEKKDMVLSRVDQLKLLSPHHHHHQHGDA